MSTPWPKDRNASRNRHALAERGSSSGIEARIKANHQDEAAGRDNDVRRKVKRHALAQMPGVGPISRVIKIHRTAGSILQFDVLVGDIIQAIGLDDVIKWVIIDLTDDHRPDLWPRVGRTDRGRQLSDQVIVSSAIDISAKSDSEVGCAEVKTVSVACESRTVA